MKFRVPFHYRLNIYVSVLFAIFAIAILFFQYRREKSFSEQTLMSTLTSYADRIDNDITKLSIGSFGQALSVKEIQSTGARITVIDPSGRVMFDSNGNDLSSIDSHIDRPEIRTARLKGVGYSIRGSKTMNKPFFYTAKFYGNHYIRVSLPYTLSTQQLLQIDKTFLLLLVILIAIIFILLFRYTGRLGKNISQLRKFTAQAEKDEGVEFKASFSDDDIGRISDDMIRIYKRLLHTRNELAAEKEKLYKHLQISNEGLAVFNASRHAVLSNSLFIKYLNIVSDTPVDSANDIFSLPEFKEVTRVINGRASVSGDDVERSTQFTIEKNGRFLDVKAILFHDNGFEISINNVTQEIEETRLKRQLTQNISHELKTPISSIQGFLETIISNPEIDEQIKQSFLLKSYDQCTRLVDLLTDISTLNRLDEAATLYDLAELNLAAIIRDVCNDVAIGLREKRMSVQLILDDKLPICGNSSLLYSIFRNLLDNAIAYAGEETTICVNCYFQNETDYFISFYDTGTGVDTQHLDRLFDRFYRVDKGRSRKMGGTGLGLAIVKNAVLFHKGEISVKRRSEGGLEFIFNLKKWM